MTFTQRLEAAGIVKGGFYRVKCLDWPLDGVATFRVYAVCEDSGGSYVRIDGKRSRKSAFDLADLLESAEADRVSRIPPPSARNGGFN